MKSKDRVGEGGKTATKMLKIGKIGIFEVVSLSQGRGQEHKISQFYYYKPNFSCVLTQKHSEKHEKSR